MPVLSDGENAQQGSLFTCTSLLNHQHYKVGFVHYEVF